MDIIDDMQDTTRRDRLTGCYVTIPTLFHDDAELSVDLDAIGQHVRFLLEGGLRTGTGVLLAGGAAGDFSTLTFDERCAVAERVVGEAAGRIPVAMGAQTTSTAELVRLAQAAERVGADFIQVSPPFYFAPTEGDFFEYVQAGADAADVGLIIYNTFWTGFGVSTGMVERLTEIPNVVGLKWSTPDAAMMTFEDVVERFAGRFAIIDNQNRYVTSHMLGRPGDRDPRGQLLAPVRRPDVGVAGGPGLRRRPARDGPRRQAVHAALGGDGVIHGR